MADPTFNLFGPLQKNDITVGYISTDRGYQTGVTVCEANAYAKLNPGTNVGIGRDHTLFSLIDGNVRFDYRSKGKKIVNVDPIKIN